MAASISNNTTYVFYNTTSNKVMDDSKDLSDPKNPVIQYYAHMTKTGIDSTPNNQIWTAISVGSAPNVFKFKNVKGTTVLTLDGSSDGAKIVGDTDTNAPSQLWQLTLESKSGETYAWSMKNPATNLYVTIPDKSVANSTPLAGYSAGAPGQSADFMKWVAWPIAPAPSS